jgi:alginate O-acetyltransferase complex protein AlgJ
LPTLDSFLHFDYAKPPGENRLLAEFPQFRPGFHGLKNYLAGLEAYFNDHFGCRKCLIKWQIKWKLQFFRDRTIRTDVIIGNEGWLYYSQSQMVEHYRGILRWTPEELHAWQMLLERRRDWLAQRGAKYYFVVAPDKHSIYPEYLPAWLKKVNPETKLDQFLEYMAMHSTVPVLDLRRAEMAARQTAPTYLKTDLHWNQFGGFVAYQELVRAMGRQIPGLAPLPLDAFTRTSRLIPGGDLNWLLGVDTTESNAIFFMPKSYLPPFKILTPTQPDQPTNITSIENPQIAGSALIFRDSFGETWVPFLAYHFSRVTCVRQYTIDAKLIEREKPVVVVNEMSERLFNTTDPEELSVKEILK